MELFRIIKKDAKSAMRSFGGRAVASVMIVFLAYLAINLTETVVMFALFGESFLTDYEAIMESSIEAVIVTACSAAAYLLVLPALSLGYAKLHLAFAEGKDESISVLFDTFSSFRKFIGSAVFAVSFIIRYTITFAVAAAPGAAFLYFAETYIPDSNRTLEILKIAACSIAVIIIILCIGLWLIFIQRWCLAPFYFTKGNKIHKAFALSAKATKGMNARIIRFRLSFLGWVLLSIFILPLLWSIPYYFLSNAIYSNYLMERYEHSLAETPEITVPEEPVEPEEVPGTSEDPKPADEPEVTSDP